MNIEEQIKDILRGFVDYKEVYGNGVNGEPLMCFLIDRLSNLVTQAQEEAFESFVGKATFIKHIPEGHTFVYENKTGKKLYIIAADSLTPQGEEGK